MNFLQDLIKVLQENYLKIFLARFLQDPLYLARKATFLVQDLQDLMKDFASLARKLLATQLQDLNISCKTVFIGRFWLTVRNSRYIL